MTNIMEKRKTTVSPLCFAPYDAYTIFRFLRPAASLASQLVVLFLS